MDKAVLFKLVWRGWFVGVTVLFVPLLLVAVIISPETPPEMKYGILMVPFIAAAQGALVGGLVLLGVTIWPIKR